MAEKIIDMHMHIEFDRSVDRNEYRAFPWLFEKYVKKNNIEKALVLTYCAKDCAQKGHSLDELIKINKSLSDYVNNKFNLFAFARVDPLMKSPNLVRLLSSFEEMNFKGIKLHPMDGFDLKDLINYNLIFDWAERKKMPVMVHTWFGNGKIDWSGVISDMPVRFVAEIAKDYDIPFIAAHANIGEDPTIKECMKTSNLYLDVSVQPMPSFAEFANKNPGLPMWNRVFYGSDFAVFRLPKFQAINLITPEKIRAQIPKDLADKLLRTNAERFIEKYLI